MVRRIKPVSRTDRIEEEINKTVGGISLSKKKIECAQEKVRYVWLEREYGRLRRFVFLPETVILEREKASFKNGVLRISLKKI